MSKYYSVATNNRFANLNLDSEDEQILSVKPDSVIKAEQDKAIKAAEDNKGFKGTKKSVKGTNKGDINKSGNKASSSPVRGGGDYEAQPDSRGRDRERNTRKAEESEKKKLDNKLRDGKKQYDRKGEFGVKRSAPEDHDPKSVAYDKDAAERDNKEEAVETQYSFNGKEKEDEKNKKPPGISVTAYLEEIKCDRYKLPEATSPQKFDDLEKDLSSAGLTCLKKADQDVVVPLGKKNDRTSKSTRATVELCDIGSVPKLYDPSNNRNRDSKKNTYKNEREENESPKKHFSKKAYKDEKLFPELE